MKNVLIVEDDIDIYEVLEYFLEEFNFNIIFTDTATKAREILSENEVDLIISDIFLNESESGIDLLKDVKKADCQIPFIIMSAYISEQNLHEVNNIGADSFVPKPIKPSYLEEKIEEALSVFKKKAISA